MSEPMTIIAAVLALSPPDAAHAYDRLRAENAPPRYLYQPPRGAAHGAMLAMLRGLHRFPPLRSTPHTPGVLPLDARILASIGYPPFSLAEANMPDHWRRAGEIQARYIAHANT